MLYSRFSLVTCFIHSSVYMSVPISRFIPPPFHPLVTVCFFAVSLFLLCTRVRLSVPISKIPHMCVYTRCFSLATIEYTAQQQCAHSRCVTISTVHLQKFSTSQPDTLCPVHRNPLSSLPSAPGNLLCALFPVIYLSWAPHTKGGLQHLSFSVWLISLRIMFSRFIHVIADVKILSLLRLKNLPLHGYTGLPWRHCILLFTHP